VGMVAILPERWIEMVVPGGFVVLPGILAIPGQEGYDELADSIMIKDLQGFFYASCVQREVQVVGVSC